MRFNLIKSRKEKLKKQIEYIALNKNVTSVEIDKLVVLFENYEKDNLTNIEKLSRPKALDTKRISGALKQTINSHGPITKELIGSATKRIFGSLLEEPKVVIVEPEKETFINKILKYLK